LCKLLCNYATRLGESVTYVDLDIGQGTITVPGMISAVVLDRPVDIEEGFGMGIASSAPIIAYFYGNVSPAQNPKLYTKQVQKLATVVHQRSLSNSSSSGVIINTMGWVDGLGYELLLQTADAFKPDTVLVIDHERLYSDLLSAFSSSGNHIEIVKMPKSGGVVARDQNRRRKARTARIKEYFYGSLGDLCPYSTVIPFSKYIILKTNVGPQAPSSALPIGAQPTSDPMKPREVTPSIDLLHSILGVSHAQELDHILETNIAGFLYVTEVNIEKSTLTVLAPCPGPLPGKYLLLGNLKYLE